MEITVSPAFEEYARLWACAERRKGSDAMMRLAWRYEYGRGAERDPSRAFAWYMQAARRGNNCAMERIAAMYESEEDYPLATKWYRRYAIAAIHERNEYLGW